MAQNLAGFDRLRTPLAGTLGPGGAGEAAHDRLGSGRQPCRSPDAYLQDVARRRRGRRRVSEVLEVKLAILLLAALPALAQTGANVLVVVNDSSLFSRRIAEYYVHKRSIPLANVCHLNAPIGEEISRQVYDKAVEAPVAACLASRGLSQTILYIVTTLGLPLRVAGSGAEMDTTACAVDSELTLLYAKMRGQKFRANGLVPNPFFGKRDRPFQHSQFPIYLVTRLAGYDFEDVKGMIDRSLQARNRGKFVIDLKSSDDQPGNDWLRAAARLLQ